MESLLVAVIRCDGGTQSRLFTDSKTIEEYKEAMIRGVQFAPVVAFFDGSDYWLADGFHRVIAAAKAGIETIAADVHEGGIEDAQIWSASSNAAHGLKRTTADKERAVKMMLDNPKVKAEMWPASRIATHCDVSDMFVASVNTGRSNNGTSPGKVRDSLGRMQPAKKARRTKKAPESSESQSGAGSISHQNKSSDESKTVESPAQNGEGKSEPLLPKNSPTENPPNTESELPRDAENEKSEAAKSNSHNSPNYSESPFESPLQLCAYLARNSLELRANPDLFDWLVTEAARLAEENQ